MGSLFSPDSKIMAMVSRAADLVILNLLFLLTSIPVITIGPSLAAMYRVVFAIGTKREDGTAGAYFAAFRENFKPAVKVWLLLLAAGVLLGADLLLFSGFWPGKAIALIMLTIEAIGAIYVFPLVSFFENTTMGTVKNALALGLGNLPVSLLLVVIHGLPWYLLMKFPWTFFSTGFIWLVIYFSAAAYITSLLLRRVLTNYLPEDTFE